MLLRRMLRIDAQAAFTSCRQRRGPKPLPLCKGIKHDMIADPQNFREFLRPIRGRKNMVFPPGHLLVSQPGLIETAGRSTGQVAADERVKMIHGKGLLSQQYMAAGLPLQISQYCEIPAQQRLVDHIGRRRYSLPHRLQAVRAQHQSTSSGVKLSCQGRPQRFSASMNGSGSNSSMLCTPGLFHFPVITSIAPIIAGTPVV